MGLDIVAFKKLSVVEEPERDEYGDLINYNTEWTPGSSMKWSEEHFPGRAEGLNADSVYTYEKIYMFKAGSYSGYNEWRDQLNTFKGKEAFQELINFADNEGVIGPVVAKKLYEDFKKNRHEALDYSMKRMKEDESLLFMELYEEWTKAFKVASDNGAVNFQ